MDKMNIGLIGLAVMGENLVLNMERNGYGVAVYNRTVEKVDAFVEGRAKGKNIKGCRSIEEFCDSLEKPRRVMMLVKAGGAVDALIDQLIPHLEKGDIIIDGGNTYFPDTIRRAKYLEEKGLLFIGTGVSGGEEGALMGPSIMPGGSKEAWQHVKGVFQSIAAKVGDGSPCCEYIGADGAGHYVKMVHNGIEYGDMQMICEVYSIMKNVLGMSAAEQAEVFAAWNKTELDSYLIEITSEILAKTDDETGKPMVDVILDTAGQKGTGKWTSSSGLDLGAPVPTVAEAVFARCLSAVKDERVAASKVLTGPEPKGDFNKEEALEHLRLALYMSKICSYAQGFQLIQYAAKEHNWDLNYGDIALMWRGGCIIRAQFLEEIKKAFDADPNCVNLLLVPYFKEAVDKAQASLRWAVSEAVKAGIPMPCLSSAISYYDSYRAEVLPANLLQAQRDYFGAHTYERLDKPRGEFFHTNWTGRGGTTASTTYNV